MSEMKNVVLCRVAKNFSLETFLVNIKAYESFCGKRRHPIKSAKLFDAHAEDIFFDVFILTNRS